MGREHMTVLRARILEIGSPKARWAGSEDEIPDLLADGAHVVFHERTPSDCNWAALSRYIKRRRGLISFSTVEDLLYDAGRVRKNDIQRMLLNIAERIQFWKQVICDRKMYSGDIRTDADRVIYPKGASSWHRDAFRILDPLAGPGTEYRIAGKGGKRHVISTLSGTTSIQTPWAEHRSPFLKVGEDRLLQRTTFTIKPGGPE